MKNSSQGFFDVGVVEKVLNKYRRKLLSSEYKTEIYGGEKTYLCGWFDTEALKKVLDTHQQTQWINEQTPLHKEDT